jgi:hypothetical protein
LSVWRGTSILEKALGLYFRAAHGRAGVGEDDTTANQARAFDRTTIARRTSRATLTSAWTAALPAGRGCAALSASLGRGSARATLRRGGTETALLWRLSSLLGRQRPFARGSRGQY